MPTFRSRRKGKKCFFVMSLRLSDHKVLRTSHLHQVFSISLGFSRFFSLVFRTSIAFALVGYDTGWI